ncbi:DUF4301 family protein [Candidatus Uabimicrobium sp. HlEnr_7]|uniref:DUF4301 family protein n=1 Tax=Candidatus Uabimicrobium helgolandensis TaxID=3095367 RepID=UPI0035581E2D
MLNESDILFLRKHDIAINDAKQQLECINKTQPYLTLSRACALDDGIKKIIDTTPLLKSWQEANSALCITKFIPASGAATRMFKELISFIDSPDNPSSKIKYFFDNIQKFAFFEEIPKEKLEDRCETLKFLLTAEGLNYTQLPKAMLLFHKSPEPRFAFEEHLSEAANYIEKDGHCHLHFTITKEHLSIFQHLIKEKMITWEERWNCKFNINFSFQQHATDSLSVNEKGQLWRDDEGKPLLRPAGHGALIRNLNKINSDIVVLKNIDNVCPDHLKDTTFLWKKVLIGLLYKLQKQSFAFLRKLHDNPNETEKKDAETFIRDSLNVDIQDTQVSVETLISLLDRPIRVCGMVPNTGEPGGGPFWVEEEYGNSCQIVEKIQIAPQQLDVMKNASHFNPVDVVCGLKNWQGEKFDLHHFVNEKAFIVVEKSHQGKYLKSTERPGLWNGSMHYWNSVFVEVPITTFTPVKTVFDLLRDEHL